MARETGKTLLMMVLGGILGGYLGELLGLLVPTGIFHEVFIKGLALGFDNPLVFNLRIIVLTFGIKIFVNLFGVFGMIVGLIYSK